MEYATGGASQAFQRQKAVVGNAFRHITARGGYPQRSMAAENPAEKEGMNPWKDPMAGGI